MKPLDWKFSRGDALILGVAVVEIYNCCMPFPLKD